MTIDDIDIFMNHYFVAALWSSTEEDCNPFDDEYEISDIDEESQKSQREECEDFIKDNADDLADLDVQQCGHDFWLTRNGHGAGFWVRVLGVIGTRLADACKPYGEAYMYVGDDGKLYIS